MKTRRAHLFTCLGCFLFFFYYCFAKKTTLYALFRNFISHEWYVSRWPFICRIL